MGQFGDNHVVQCSLNTGRLNVRPIINSCHAEGLIVAPPPVVVLVNSSPCCVLIERDMGRSLKFTWRILSSAHFEAEEWTNGKLKRVTPTATAGAVRDERATVALVAVLTFTNLGPYCPPTPINTGTLGIGVLKLR